VPASRAPAPCDHAAHTIAIGIVSINTRSLSGMIALSVM
jgi:hypothetical protein